MLYCFESQAEFRLSYFSYRLLKDVRFCPLFRSGMGRREHVFVITYQYGTQQQPFHRWMISRRQRNVSRRRRRVFEEWMDSRNGEIERNSAVANRRQTGNHWRELFTQTASWDDTGRTGKDQGDYQRTGGRTRVIKLRTKHNLLRRKSDRVKKYGLFV